MTVQIRLHDDIRRGVMPVLLASLLAWTLATTATEVVAEDSPPAAMAQEKTERCIIIRSIRQTKVVDDQTIIFYTTGNRNYKNRLPHSCSGLAMADSFSYRTSQSQLCSVDIITVLNRMGSDLAPGPACGLGEFEQIDARQLEELTRKPEKK